MIFFGVGSGNFRATDVEFGRHTTFTMVSPDGTRRVSLGVPGVHNVTNYLAAAAACRAIGVPLDEIVEALAGFTAPKWRMETIALPGPRGS